MQTAPNAMPLRLRSVIRLAVALAAASTLYGCTRQSRLHRVMLWEGPADCGVCRATAVTLWPNGPTRVSLRADSVYTAQLELDAVGGSDRCIFRFIGGSWELPTHEFHCDPEQDVMWRSLSTRRFSVPPGPDTLGLRVSVLSSSERTGIQLLLDQQRYEVDWIR
jgi:hypothetical protein